MHPVLGVNPPAAGTAQPSRGGRWSCPECLSMCPHSCSTSDMPSAKARRTSVPWLPHAACLMLSPQIPCLVPKRWVLGGPSHANACAKVLTALAIIL